MGSHSSEVRRAGHILRRTRALMFLGGMCNRCGNNDSRVLQIDHVNGGGLEEVKRYGANASRLHNDVFANPKKYQVLCANCNWIKVFDNDEVHRRPRGKMR